jgi:hypothetical protein
MRVIFPRLVVALGLALVAGCIPVNKGDNKGVIEGTRWSSLAERMTLKTPGINYGKTVPIPAGYMELDFQQDGTLYYIINGTIFKGKYTLGPGKNVVFTLEQPIAGRTKHVESIRIEGDRLTMEDTDGTTLHFRRR